jgi:hypothetical protein
MNLIKQQHLLELESKFIELYDFYYGRHNRNERTLNKEEIKQADKIRRRIRKLMTLLYSGYYPSMGGFGKASYRFMFKNKKDASQFIEEIIPISKLYKRAELKKMNQINYKVTLNTFLSDEEFFNHVDSIID